MLELSGHDDALILFGKREVLNIHMFSANDFFLGMLCKEILRGKIPSEMLLLKLLERGVMANNKRVSSQILCNSVGK